MPIELEEIEALGEAWCDTLREGDAPASQRARFFLNPSPRIYIQETGVSITLDEHAAYHSQFARQVLTLGDFTVTQLSQAPERARAIGSLYWEAHYPEDTAPPLRCVVGEDWIVERVPTGELKFVLWINTMHHFLPDSAVRSLDV